MKHKAYRHGEICLVRIDNLPEGIEISNTKTLMVGSHGNSHTIENGDIYLKKDGDFTFGYLVAKDTSLLHPEHSPKVGEAKVEDGVYQLVKQNEFTPDGLIPVID